MWCRQVIQMAIVLPVLVRAALRVPALVDMLVVLHQAEVRLATLRVVVMEDTDQALALVVVVDLLVAQRDILRMAAKVVMAMEVKDLLDFLKILEVMAVDGLMAAQALMVKDLLVVVELPVVMGEELPKRLRLRNTYRYQQSRS